MAYDPYTLAFPAPTFALSSDNFTDGGPLPLSAYNTDQGDNESPALRWVGLPTGTVSVVVTAFDADAPIPGGLWHWAVKNIPAEAELPSGAGSVHGAGLPAGAVTLLNDLGEAGYSGVQPPPGTGRHRLFVAATALSVATLPLPPGASIALLNIAMIPHTLGRSVISATCEAPPAR